MGMDDFNSESGRGGGGRGEKGMDFLSVISVIHTHKLFVSKFILKLQQACIELCP